MNKSTAGFTVSDITFFKKQMLNWANRFNIFLFLDSHGYRDQYSAQEWVLAAGAAAEFNAKENALQSLEQFQQQHAGDWLFGHIGYDFKNQVEPLGSSHPDGIGFPDIFFFNPAIVIRRIEGGVEISSSQEPPAVIFEEILDIQPQPEGQLQPVELKSRIEKQDYIETIEKLRHHILRGDCYEINFCQEFFAEHAVINPLQCYQQLSSASPAPFAGFYRLHHKYLLCASPERFICKRGSKIVSQPIKGTAPRNQSDPGADALQKQQLLASQKEKSENVMIVDLVRNDFSKICNKGSVRVEELYGVYSFPQVHQLISTVTGELPPDTSLAAAIGACFPMGSMTGAPKRRVMELTEQYEKMKRGIYSGSIGYISPDGDFDFNVVIRSIMYNQTHHYVSCQVGGGITFYSDPEREYEECLVKAGAIKKVLRGAAPL